MKRLLIALLLSVTLAGCATTGTTPATPQVAAQDVATKSLLSVGAVLQAAPGIVNALYDAGKLSKADYNNFVMIYNQALASFNLADEALQVAIKAGQDPNMTIAYTTALANFMTSKKTVSDLIAAMGEKLPEVQQ